MIMVYQSSAGFPTTLLLAHREIHNHPAAHLTVWGVLKWFNMLLSVCLGLWISNGRLSVWASFRGGLLTGWRYVCQSLSFFKWDMKYNGCFLRMSLLLWVINAKAPCEKILYTNQRQLCSVVTHRAVKSMFLFWCFPFLLLLILLPCFANWSYLKFSFLFHFPRDFVIA